MAFLRNFLSPRFHSLLRPQNPLCVYYILHSIPPYPHKFPPFHHRPIASSPETQNLTNPESERKGNKKLLNVLFKETNGLLKKKDHSESAGEGNPENKELRQLEGEAGGLKAKSKEGEAVGLSEKTEYNENEIEGEGERDPKNKELRRKLGGECRSLKAKSKEGVEKRTLYALFTNQFAPVNSQKELKLRQTVALKEEKPKKAKLRVFTNQIATVNTYKEEKLGETVALKEEKPKKAKSRRLRAVFTNQIAPANTRKEVKLGEPVVFKELSPDMEIFVNHLYKEGYFNDANLLKGKSFDLRLFQSYSARNYILYAALKFGKDKQEIAKWLSGSDLKQLAMLGCPSVKRSYVFPAKRLRNFFEIPENTVCSRCMLRQSCKFVNQRVWNCSSNNLDLATALKVITSYAMVSEQQHPLVVQDEIKNLVSRLLKEVLKLSQSI